MDGKEERANEELHMPADKDRLCKIYIYPENGLSMRQFD